MINATDLTHSILAAGPPKHSISDYLVLILLSCCIAVGAPMTIMICHRLIQRLRLAGAFKCGHTQNRGPTRYTPEQTPNLNSSKRSDLLKLQLNIADLMVLTFYAFSKIIWTLTYQWKGTEFLCKLVRFLSVLSFHMCTNSVVCIGLDRMIILFKPERSRQMTREYVMVGISCLLAFMCSLPQFWIWTVVEVWTDWYQCVPIWNLGHLLTETQMALADVYNIFHLLTIFWIPCAIIAVSYIVIVMHVVVNLKEPSNSQRGHSDGRKGTPDPSGHRKKFGQGLLKCGQLTRFLCRQTLTILTVYIICWAPYNALTILVYFRPEYKQLYLTMIRFLQELIVVNSVINPFLYACDVYHQIVNERSRQGPESCLCCCFNCPCAFVEDSEIESEDMGPARV